MSRPVLVMAGGTGGHVFPGLAVASVLKERDVPVVWLGSVGGMEQRLVPQHGIAFEAISVRGLRGKGWLRLLRAPFELLHSLLQALAVLRRVQPRSVLSLGGYAAGPGGLAARCLRVPLAVHEQNRIPGLTNRVLSRLAQALLTGFPDSFPGRGRWVGNPVRPTIATLPLPAERFADRRGRLRLLVLGGSQGARALNRLLPAALALIDPALRPQVVHQTGAALHQEACERYRELGIEVDLRPFIDDMAQAYADADLVICRAGALTLAELCAAGLGALLVPYPHAVDDHQSANARWMVEAGGAELWPESGLDAGALAERITALSADRGALLQMAERARAHGRSDAASAVANACLEIAR